MKMHCEHKDPGKPVRRVNSSKTLVLHKSTYTRRKLLWDLRSRPTPHPTPTSMGSAYALCHGMENADLRPIHLCRYLLWPVSRLRWLGLLVWNNTPFQKMYLTISAHVWWFGHWTNSLVNKTSAIICNNNGLVELVGKSYVHSCDSNIMFPDDTLYRKVFQVHIARKLLQLQPTKKVFSSFFIGVIANLFLAILWRIGTIANCCCEILNLSSVLI